MIDDWFDEEAENIEATALMLSSVGTPAFHAYSRSLYGAPDVPLRYDPVTPLDLAKQVHRVIDELARVDLGATPPASRSAEDVAAELAVAVARQFGEDAPRVEVVAQLSANALATSKRIRVRQGALFTDRDAAQLLQHEAFIHVATSLNGQAQEDLPILAVGRPGTTRTQEGIAVFSEFVSGTLERDRFRRLADRVLAVQMAIDGADFVEVYRWLAESSASPEQAFENTRRVFRGGEITGGSPFTKGRRLPVRLPAGEHVRAGGVRRRPGRLSADGVRRQARHLRHPGVVRAPAARAVPAGPLPAAVGVRPAVGADLAHLLDVRRIDRSLRRHRGGVEAARPGSRGVGRAGGP